MKKACLLAFCFFLVLAFICGCDDGAEESSMPVLSTDSGAVSVLSDADSASDGESVGASFDESEPSAESSEESAEESSKDQSESSVERSEDESEPEESSGDESEPSVESAEDESEPEESSKEQSKPPVESSEEESKPPVETSKDESKPPKPPVETSKDESSEIEESSKEDESSVEESDEEPDESSMEESSMEESSEVQPPETSEDDEVSGIGDAEMLPTGYLIYNGAAYAQAHFSETQSKRYADVYARYAELFPDVGIHVINHPLSAINIPNAAVREMTNNQRAVLNLMEQCIYGDVNFVNLGAIFEEHRGEYMYFKSDYHWTQLGAYYAYCAFALSMGYEPTPLESFERKIVNDKFIGHTNDYAHDDRILTFYDTIYAYMPIKEHTYAVYHSDLTLYRVFNNCIQTSIDNYSCFLTGDQAYAVINVPENDQDKTVLVIKDSSANAFVPFLAEHYGNIIIIDPRMYRPDVRGLVEEQGVDDIIFFATASTSNGSTYCDYYREMLG